MLWSAIRWIKASLFVDSLTSSSMPESGDVDVLTPLPPTTFTTPRQSFADRRRISLKLDIGGHRGHQADDHHMKPKKCKLESVTFLDRNGVRGNPSFRTMSPGELARRFSSSHPVLVLDCRHKLAYDLNHIQGAVHVSCGDRFIRQKLQQGKVGVVDLVSSKEGKDLFNKRVTKDVVIYDDHTKDFQGISSDNALQVVLMSLIKEGREAFVLQGGLRDFFSAHSHLCDTSIKQGFSRPLYSPTTAAVEPESAEIETATASQILPFLYLGNERDAANLQRLRDLKITYVLNITAHLPLCWESHGIKYKRIPASDSCQQNLKQYFEEAIEFIDDARQNGCRVLVHCQAGVSRSATVTIAYILKHTRMTMTDAYKFVKGKRAIISPNFNFMGQLMEFEGDLNRGLTPRILQPRLQGMETSV